MKTELIVEKSIEIKATEDKIFNALINPEKIKQYMFGTEATSDWKVGSTIAFNGDYQGHKYKDKGIILKNEAPQIFQYRYWSSMSGMEDVPSNYATVTFNIDTNNGENRLHVTQEGFSDTTAQEHSAAGWMMILDHIKKIVEKG